MGHVVLDIVPFYTSEIFGLFFGVCWMPNWREHVLSKSGVPCRKGVIPHTVRVLRKQWNPKKHFSFWRGRSGNNEKRAPDVLFLITDCTCRGQFKSIELLQIIVKGIMGGGSSNSRLQSSSGKRLSIILTVPRTVSGSLTNFNSMGRLIEDGQAEGVEENWLREGLF